MKAVVRDEYGSPEVLRVENAPTPMPASNELLVRVVSASVAKGDWEILRGSPLWVRLAGFGLLKPRARILGYNFSGYVEAVGDAVTQFDVGDEVFGDVLHSGLGAFAEYVSVSEDAAVIRKPEALSHDDAASVPEAGCIALQTLEQAGDIEPGMRVLINGGGGGAGTFAIQLAKSAGAIVTGVDRVEKLELMRSLGADQVVDYSQTRVRDIGESFDLILDVVGVGSLHTWKALLREGGVYLAAGGTVAYIFKTLLLGFWYSIVTSKKFGVLAVSPTKDAMRSIADLLDAGQVKATIDRTYPLDDTPAAVRRLGDGMSQGKLVIRT